MKNTYIKSLEITKNTENIIQGTINRIQDPQKKKGGDHLDNLGFPGGIKLINQI
jgi:hypothetical protein